MRFLFVLLFVASTAWARSEPTVLLQSLDDREAVVSKNVKEVRPIASITKLMTALVALDLTHDPNGRLDVYKGLGGILPKSPSFTRREILTAMLVRSDNSAAETLARDHPEGRLGFMQAMNDRARRMGMRNTHFDDPSGLSSKNTSTAEDIVILLNAALANDVIRSISVIQRTELVVENRKKPVKVLVQNTNLGLLEQFNSIVVSKTGLTTPAGWCVALIIEERGKNYALVVLGSKTKVERAKTVERVVFENLRTGS